MISVVIDARGGAEALARLLAGLVPAAADGVVREVLVFGADARSRDVADDAGARICADFAGAATAAKGPWLALLPLGVTVGSDFIAAMATHAQTAEEVAARLCVGGGLLGARTPEGWLAPIGPRTSARPVQKDFERLARRSGRRLRVLDRR